MKTLRTGAFLLLGIFSIISLKAQTVGDIVTKHINAIGGKSVLSAIKTVYIESSMSIMGNDAPSTTYILNGKAYKSEFVLNGTKIVQCVTDKGGWTINPMTGNAEATAMPDDQVKASQSQLQIGGLLYDYAARGYKPELLGKDTSGGVTSYKIKFKMGEGEMTYYIDANTYLIDKAVNKSSISGQELETTISFSDYRKTDFGCILPYMQKLILPQITLEITNTKIEINTPIDPAIFVMPGK